MKEFTTAVAEVVEQTAEEEWPLTFKLDGRIMHVRRPMPGEAIVMISALAGHQDTMSKFGAILDLVTRVMRDDDRDWWNRRILNPADPLSQQAPKILAGDGDEHGIAHEIVELWSSRPTESSEDSSDSPPQGGSSSTPSSPEPIY